MNKLTTSQCLVCDAPFFPDRLKSVTVKDYLQVSRDEFHLYRCDQCRTWILNPRLSVDSLAPFYQEDFLGTRGRSSQSLLGKLAHKHREFNWISELRWVDKYTASGDNYLDYSAGNGQFLSLFSERKSLNVFATEYSSSCRTLLGQILEPERIKEDIRQFEPALKFDAITVFGVIEHVDSPRDLISSLKPRLKPGGKLLITQPNPESWQCVFLGSRWFSWLAPRHICIMNMRTLQRTLEDAGFRVLEKKNYFFRDSSATIILSFSQKSIMPRDMKSWRLIIFAIFFYLLVPIEFLASLFGRSGFMGIVVEKAE